MLMLLLISVTVGVTDILSLGVTFTVAYC